MMTRTATSGDSKVDADNDDDVEPPTPSTHPRDSIPKFPIGTPLIHHHLPSSNNNGTATIPHLSVVSWNILAPCYVRPIDRRTNTIQPFAAFEWIVADDVLDANCRQRKIVNILQNCQADILCLQEVQLERTRNNATTTTSGGDKKAPFGMPQWMEPLLRENYEAHLPPQIELEQIAERNVRVLGVENAPVTCAVLVRKKTTTSNPTWVAVTTTTTTDEPTLPRTVAAAGTVGDACDNNKQKTKRRGRTTEAKMGDTNTCVSVCIRPITTTTHINININSNNKDDRCCSAVVVTSVHLDAMDEEKRINQLSRCLHRARDLMTTTTVDQDVSPIPTIIIAGDMNQEFRPGSCVASFLNGSDTITDSSSSVMVTEADLDRECISALRLSTRPTKVQMKEWKELHKQASQSVYDHCVSLARIDTGPTRSAYDHPDDDNEKDDEKEDAASTTTPPPRAMAQWSLDHILYSTDVMRPVARWSTLEDDPAACASGLPNDIHPSDHIPIAALFEITTTVGQISEGRTGSLSNRLRDLSIAHNEAFLKVKSEYDLLIAAMEVKVEEKQDIETAAHKSATTQNRTKKKPRKQKPPPEVMEMIRRQRSALRDLKAKQQSERNAFVATLNHFERAVLQQEVGCVARRWVEEGSTSS